MNTLSHFLLQGSSRNEMVGADASAGFLTGAVISGMLGCSREVRIVCAAAGCIVGGLIGVKHHDQSLHGARERVWQVVDPKTGECSYVGFKEIYQKSLAGEYGIVDFD